MEAIMLLLIFILIGFIGFIIMKNVDAFFEERRNGQMYAIENREDIIRIVCENPIMLPYVSKKIEEQKKEFKRISFCFYTGCRDDIEKALADGNYDIALFIGEPGAGEDGCYRKKISSFVPASIYESLTGLDIEPVESERTVMYVLWNEKYITEIKRKMISVM